jgi:hypothetical protein
MAYQLYQILLYNFPLDKVCYPRPCVIIDIATNGKLAMFQSVRSDIRTKMFSSSMRCTRILQQAASKPRLMFMDTRL